MVWSCAGGCDFFGEGPHECSEEVLAARKLTAVEDVVAGPAEADKVVGVAKRWAAAHPGRFDMGTVYPGVMTAGDKTFGALPAEDLLDELQVVHAGVRVSAKWL